MCKPAISVQPAEGRAVGEGPRLVFGGMYGSFGDASAGGEHAGDKEGAGREVDVAEATPWCPRWVALVRQRFATWLLVSLCAAAGCWVRGAIKGVVETYGVVSGAYLLPNVIGSWFLGYLHESRLDYMLLVGLRVGFCGTLTTFSSYALACAQELVNEGNTAPTSGQGVVWFQYQVVGFLSGMAAYIVGLESRSNKQNELLTSRRAVGDAESPHSDSHVLLGEEVLNQVVYVVVTFCAILYSSLMLPWQELELFLHAIVGCNLRWFLSYFNHPSDNRRLPAGTFVANAIACVCISFTHSPHLLTQQFREAFSNGFCGGLSTFSTFAKELFHMYTSNDGRRGALTYFFITILLNQVVIITILTALVSTQGAP